MGHVERLRHRYFNAAKIGLTKGRNEQTHFQGNQTWPDDPRPTTQDRAMRDIETTEQTFGERAVGLTFNPSGDDKVNVLKGQAAAFIDSCNDWRDKATDPEVKRMYSLAISDAQVAQMWGVKAATWK
jgi:hypothetical protein